MESVCAHQEDSRVEEEDGQRQQSMLRTQESTNRDGEDTSGTYRVPSLADV